MNHFNGRYFQRDITLATVGHYFRFSLSYRDIVELDVSWFLRQLLREGIMNKSSLKMKEFLHANSLRQRIQTKHYQPI